MFFLVVLFSLYLCSNEKKVLTLFDRLIIENIANMADYDTKNNIYLVGKAMENV